ncbi:MAG: Zn-ribbon domain-containing OB-fold protein [Acidilobaceae archaeon]|nr:Zn-ribbon domain-containing OB-fold protein [Acidilobaceae archaeon]MCX8165051.1 Zn-ribbon domain-containing OB-fold protein [Acidilobaceae archaeon]MDW7974432.1 Zn-ribbon domain-containing OB-fold protein [Sulfolobales archaeon]
MNKRGSHGEVAHVEGEMEVEKYVYPPGTLGERVAEALLEGKLLGIKCGNDLLVPARPYCPDYGRGELVEVQGPWTVESYTIIYKDMRGERLKEPQVIALLKPEGAQGGLIHYLKAEKVFVGLKARPVFKPREERRGVLSDILYFIPVE